MIQSAAEAKGAVFFADAGDGNDFETPTLEGEDMMGWLIPTDKANEFEPMWEQSDVSDEWSDFFVWAVWKRDGDKIKVEFEE